MAKSISDVRKSRGRPAVNAVPITVRMPPDQLAKLDAWIAAQPSPMSRPEAIRAMVQAVLAPVSRRS
jgi:hypothetical protein